MIKRNKTFKTKLSKNMIPQWFLAMRLRVSENTLIRKLRIPLAKQPKLKNKINKAIIKIKQEREM